MNYSCDVYNKKEMTIDTTTKGMSRAARVPRKLPNWMR